MKSRRNVTRRIQKHKRRQLKQKKTKRVRFSRKMKGGLGLKFGCKKYLESLIECRRENSRLKDKLKFYLNNASEPENITYERLSNPEIIKEGYSSSQPTSKEKRQLSAVLPPSSSESIFGFPESP